MNKEAASHLRRAHASIRASESMLAAKDYPGFVVSRAYYAMYYAATALLEQHGLSYGKHSSVISTFGRDFANTGKVPLHLHRYFIDAFDERATGDYETNEDLTESQAIEQLAHAKEFIAETEKFLNQQP